jgi:hypothetical protein
LISASFAALNHEPTGQAQLPAPAFQSCRDPTHLRSPRINRREGVGARRTDLATRAGFNRGRRRRRQRDATGQFRAASICLIFAAAACLKISRLFEKFRTTAIAFSWCV